jgi:hypothetical protein
VTEVLPVGVELRSDHDLLLRDYRLRAVALHIPAECFEVLRVGIGRVDLPTRLARRHVWLGWASKPPAVLHHPPLPVGLVGRVCLTLHLKILHETPLASQKLARAVARHRPSVRPTAIIQLALGVAKPPFTTLHTSHDQPMVEPQLHAATSTPAV